jgi:S1-C subfamily serine protease
MRTDPSNYDPSIWKPHKSQATQTGYPSKVLSVVLVAWLAILVGRATFGQTRPPSSASDIYQRCHTSVVVIISLDKEGNATGQGSGFIVAPNRVVTNHHVLAGSSDAVVIFADGGKEMVEGYLADSANRDLAVIAVKTGNRAQLRSGDELALRQGDPVYAIGAPRGLDLSITNGIVSGFRNLDDQFVLQTTAAIAPGSSGGPLFNDQGEVVGVTTSLLTDSPGIYFSVGIGDVARILRSASSVVLPIASMKAESKPDQPPTESTSLKVISDYIAAKDYASARKQLEPLLQKTPKDPTLNCLLGQVDLYQGDLKSGLAHLKIAVDGSPSDVDSQFFYALGLFFAGQYEESAHFQEAVVKTSPSAANLGFLSQIYYAKQEYSKAEGDALEALGKDSSDDSSLEVLAGNIYWGRSRSGYSWNDILTRLQKAKSDSYWVKVSTALNSMRQRKFNEADTVLESARRDYFPDPAADYLLAYSKIQQGDIGAARSFNEEALSDYSDNITLLNQALFVALIGHDETAASSHYARLEKISGEGSTQQISAACLYYYGTSKSQLAVDSCRKQATLSPKDHIAHSNYAWAALDADQFNLALTEFGSAYDLVKGNLDSLTQTESVDLVWGFAIASFYTGDKKTCKKLLQDIRKSDPSMLTITGLEQLPLVWSRKTTTRIEEILRDVRL